MVKGCVKERSVGNSGTVREKPQRTENVLRWGKILDDA